MLLIHGKKECLGVQICCSDGFGGHKQITHGERLFLQTGKRNVNIWTGALAEVRECRFCRSAARCRRNSQGWLQKTQKENQFHYLQELTLPLYRNESQIFDSISFGSGITHCFIEYVLYSSALRCVYPHSGMPHCEPTFPLRKIKTDKKKMASVRCSYAVIYNRYHTVEARAVSYKSISRFIWCLSFSASLLFFYGVSI